MGAFFTNVQVLASGDGRDAAHAAILECLHSIASERGLIPCEDGAQADRGFIVRRGHAWLSVYDQASESQDLTILDGLAERLSASSHCPALAVLVHDSDHLFLRLFENGERIDQVECGKTKPKIERWSKIAPSEQQAALRASLASRDLISEQTLSDVAAILGIEPDFACTGYRYLTEEGAVPEESVHLRFRRAVPPAHGQPAEGPPRLTGVPFMTPITIAVGGALRTTTTARNEGGAGRNFYVLAHGSAIDAGLVELEKVQVRIGLGPEKGGAILEASAQRRPLPDSRPCFLADFPEGEVPASNAGGHAALIGLDSMEASELVWKAQIHSLIEGRAVSTGAGDLFISIVCREAREHIGQQGFKITVAPTPRKPLRGHSEDPSHYLALSSPEAIVALAASTLNKSEAAPIAAEIVEKWSHMWPRQITLDATIFGVDEAGRAKKPGRATLKVDGLTKGAAWKKVRTAFSEANCVGALRELERRPGEPPRGGDGFSFGTSLVRSFAEVAGDESHELPTLRLVVSLEGREDVPQLVERARSLVDEFVARARCAQAVMMRCRAGRAFGLDQSAYENACGIGGQHTLHRDWGTRFLRGVGADGIWLGRDLMAHVDRGALDALCHLEPIGETVRAVLREGATLDALEAVLAPLLPSKADWREAAQARGVESRAALERLGIDLGGTRKQRPD